MPIDIGSLREDIRQLDTEELLTLLDQAIEMIPNERLPELVESVFELDSYIVEEISEKSLLEAVQHFHASSLSGYYYEDFNVNSKNFMDQSRGTINFIAEYRRLTNRCIKESSACDPGQLRQAFELLFNLLEEIDECRDDIIFFADEGGAWQVGMDEDQVLPCYFNVLAAVAKPKEYAQSVVKIVKSHADYDSDKYFKLALKIAKPSQRKTLKASLSQG